MHLIIDANVFQAFYQETVIGLPRKDCSSSPCPIFERLRAKKDFAYLDSKGILKYEWSNLVDETWFNEWYPQMLIEGFLQIVDPVDVGALRKKIENLGFPCGSRDIWYVKVAASVVGRHGNSHIISEDVDFYEPQSKGCGEDKRQKILSECSGHIPKALRKEGIEPCSIAYYLCFFVAPAA